MKLFTRTDSTIVKQTLRIFKEEAIKDRRQLIILSLLIPFSNFLYLVLIPLITSFIIQVLVEDPTNTTALAWLIGGLVFASIGTIITNKIGFDQLFVHEERVTTRLLQRALDALLRHSHSYFANQKVGSLANDANNFSRSYMVFMDIINMQLNNILVSYIASLIVIAFIAPLLLIPLGALTVFVVWHSLHSMQVRAPYRNKRKELQSRLLGQIADVIGNHALVRLFGQSKREIKIISKERDEITDVAIKEIDLLQRNARTRQFILFGFQIMTIILVIWLLQNALVSIGAVIFAITYLARVTSTMYNINGIIRGAEQAFLDAAKITEMLQLKPEVQDIKQAKPLRVTSGKIHFDSISFAYADAKHEEVIKDLDLTIEAGQRVGLVGRSGGGKTTLTNLLLRYADTTKGVIKIDDQAIHTVTQDSLRQSIAYVPQDPFLFHRSLRDNIAYGSPNATDDDIKAAAEKANAMEFIRLLPQGLDTIVGERGIKLSGGQRQRIAIARAILKNVSILVLDEATSALDSESEKKIQSALDNVMSNRTSIVVAHRLSTIAKLDRIIVLDAGTIIEDGTHESLIEQNGVYAKLWNHQVNGIIEE